MGWLWIGTYSQVLGHVNGKAKGVYGIFVGDEEAAGEDRVAPRKMHGVAQLGEHVVNPSFLCSYRDDEGSLFLYIGDERVGPEGGFVASARVDEATGELSKMGETVCVRGRATCFLTVAPGGEHILVANYLDGSLVAVDRHADGTLGAVHEVKLPPSEYAGAVGSFPRANADRQDDAHAHMVKVSKVNEDGSAMLLVPDLGCDCVWMVEYTPRRAELPMRVVGMWPEQQGDVPAGAGPRHVVLHPSKDVNVAYVACELSSQVIAVSVDASTGRLGRALPPGAVNVLQARAAQQPHAAQSPFGASDDAGATAARCDVLAAACAGGRPDKLTSVAAIRVAPKGDFLYLSNRVVGGDGIISALALAPDGSIAQKDARAFHVASTLGEVPRDFVFWRSGNETDEALQLIVANQESGSLVSLSLGAASGGAHLLAEVPTPVCIALAPEDDLELSQ